MSKDTESLKVRAVRVCRYLQQSHDTSTVRRLHNSTDPMRYSNKTFDTQSTDTLSMEDISFASFSISRRRLTNTNIITYSDLDSLTNFDVDDNSSVGSDYSDYSAAENVEDVIDKRSKTYLHALAVKREWDAIDEFLKDPDIPDGEKKDALCYAGGDRGVNNLTVAIGSNAPCSVIQRILNVAPSTIVTSKDKYGFTPLHAVCADERDIEVVKLLVDRSPLEIFNAMDNDGHTSFHLAVANKANLEVVQLILNKTSPNVFRTFTRSGKSPLHLGCIFGADQSVMQLLVDMTPLKIFSHKDYSGRSPLHSVCANEEVSQNLFPTAQLDMFKQKQIQGYNPFSYKPVGKRTAEIVQLLLKKTPPETYRSTGKEGYSLFALACAKAPLEVVQLIHEKTPQETFNSRDKKGSTPLRSACILLKVCWYPYTISTLFENRIIS